MNALATGDLNNDHKLDLVTVNSDNTLSVLLNQPGADFKISASSPNPNTVSAGQSATSTVKVSLLGAYFNNPVSLACSAKPLDAGSPNCSFDQNSLSPEPGGSATATLTIQTNLAASFAVVQRQPSWPMLFAWWPVAAFALMGTGLGSRRRTVPKKMVVGILAGLLFVGFVFQIACGGGGSSGPQVKTYTIMVTGMSGSVMHSTGMTLTVQ